MSLSETLRSLTGRRYICPNEADIVTYLESKLSLHKRSSLERHFAGCDDCRELLVHLGREAAETHSPSPDEDVQKQTAKVLSMIHADEVNRAKPELLRRTFFGLDVSYLTLGAAAVTICAIAIIAILLVGRGQKPAETAMLALSLAVRDGRQTEARVSGGLIYSPYKVSRGLETNDRDLQFSRAISQMRFAEQETAPVNDRLVLARIYLVRGTREDVRHALAILDQLAARGFESSEALSDAGVAQFELSNYEDAIGYFTRALAKSPTYYEALFNRALAEEHARHIDQARKDWEQFIDKSSDDGWKSEARMHLTSLAGVSDRQPTESTSTTRLLSQYQR